VNPLSQLQVRIAADQNFVFQGPITLGDGAAISSLNDAAGAFKGLEFKGTTVYINGTTAMFDCRTNDREQRGCDRVQRGRADRREHTNSGMVCTECGGHGPLHSRFLRRCRMRNFLAAVALAQRIRVAQAQQAAPMDPVLMQKTIAALQAHRNEATIGAQCLRRACRWRMTRTRSSRRR
jgi:hypothetical protein